MTGHFPRHAVQSRRHRWLVFHRFPKIALCSSLVWPLQKRAWDAAWANEISPNQTDFFFVNIYFAEVPEKCWLWQLTKINFHTGEKWEPRATARTNTGNLNMRNNVGLWGGSRLGEGDGTEGEVEAILHHFSTHCLIMGRIFWIYLSGWQSEWKLAGGHQGFA